ncbi:L-threonylcarbamoyladenylate synthase [Allomuricauda sp.]|uniref:L-threonylcarbamoyladenylate synthase n=1 Tax=Flagellimonas sp. TaxID=2058762 RepID=UPI001B2A5A22|nr:L-threonylcarbamoyladenylate synthase [Allomuricauda sp.]MBO6829599.1 threonylcarbamoyl-AMP synthase [Allomuricauda sp.]
MLLGPDELEKAVAILKKNDVLAIPTETVYGLAGNIYSEEAIAKIFELKKRPLNNPLIVHLHKMEQVHEIVAEFPSKAKLLAEQFWPGPLTLVLKKGNNVPDLVTAGKDTVAIRIPDHPVTLALLEKLPFPIAAPSANPFNRISPTSAEHVHGYFQNTLAVLDGGACKKGIESTIIGFEGEEPILYRLGSISKETIEELIGEVRVQNKAKAAPNAPGMLKKHYAPTTKTYLTDNAQEMAYMTEGKKVGLLRFTGRSEDPNYRHIEVLSPSGDLAEATANLYGALHRLDSMKLDMIIAERAPHIGLGVSINDRLERATQ